MSKQVFNNRQSIKRGIAIKSFLISMILSLVFTSVSFAEGGGRYEVDAWSFGVHGDTQWTVQGNSEDNPNTVSAALARAVSAELRDHNVKFVVQTGDLTDYAGAASLATRALVAKETLYDFGIGFFPIRGNHETYGNMMGWDPLYNLNVPDFKNNFLQTQGQGPDLFGATNFSSPASTNDILKGLSYSFDFGTPGNNARFVFVDTEQTAAVPSRAPNDTDNVTAAQGTCNTAITTGYTVSGITYGGAPAGTTCGQGYYYILWDWVEGGYKTNLIVYQATVPITGITTNYNSAGTSTGTSTITIAPGTWFRIDSSKRPSTNFYAYDMPNPDGIYQGKPFDINYSISDTRNRILTQISSANTEYWPGAQQSWISAQLDKTTRGTEHAFVFSHRPIINGNHVDSFFGTSSDVTPADQNTFIASLQNNDVKFMISGHDHLYNRALDKSPDGLSEVMQIVTQGISTKFYAPQGVDVFGAAIKARETQISQEVYNFGYYVYTVDGPRVTVDYYSDSFGHFKDGDYYPDGDPGATPPVLGSLEVPNFDFVINDSWGYSLNGKQFLIAQGASYTGVEDSFGNTTAKILAGTNTSTSTDLTPKNADGSGGPRALIKTVNTGWVAKTDADKPCCDGHNRGQGCKNHHQSCKTCKDIKSDILSLWGMSELGADEETDIYVISMSFDFNKKGHPGNGGTGIATFVDGEWVNAVGENFGEGKTKYVIGPYKPQYGLGTYGIDPITKTAWAVLDYNADFAVVDGIKIIPRHGHWHGHDHGHRR